MTMTTHLRVVEPTNVRRVFAQARRILGAEQATYRETAAGTPIVAGSDWLSDNHRIGNDLNQGYSALLWVKYGADGPLKDDPCECEGSCICPPKASIEISFDTAYGYEAENGAHCGDLHAWLVQEMGDWLTSEGLTWHWANWENCATWQPSSASVRQIGDPEKGALRQPQPV